MLLFIDFRKAFDTVDSNLLLKLGHYGFDNNALPLLANFFQNRFQIIKPWYNNLPSSQPLPIQLGVPQGSCLGPLLFLIFINNLPQLLDFSTILFADEPTLYLVCDDLPTLQREFLRQNQRCNRLVSLQ